MSTFEKKMKLLGKALNLIRNQKRISPEKTIISTIKTIVVVNNKRLGDFIFSTPAIRSLREANPLADIVVVTSKKNAAMINETPFFNKVFFMNNTLIDAIKTGVALRALRPEVGVIFHSKSPYDIISLTIAGVPCIMKHYFGNERKVLLDVCDGYIIGGTLPPLQNDLLLIEKLGIKNNNTDMFFPSPVPVKKEMKCLKIGLQLGASGADRYFPLSTASSVIKNLHTIYPDCEFHLIGSAQECILGDKLLNMVSSECKDKLINHIGKTTINELACIINNLSLLLTPDTGSLHIATALKTKTVSLFTSKQSNASIPQQDTHLHTVLYASDYAANHNEQSKLASIPDDVITKSVVHSCTTF